ncbi:MAG: hypothetical protein AMXMBFR47_25930 [Planctomycetota bacterium]
MSPDLPLSDRGPGHRAGPRERFLGIIESATIFILGVALMNFIYSASSVEPGRNIGVPEHDSFYHVKMAVMMPQVGLLREFPWLQYAYFRNEGSEFVSHHVGFQALLVPFVYAAHWITGDYLAGGRWAIAAFFGLNLMLFNLLLKAGNVPWRWLWIALFLALPDQYFSRHTSVRAIGASFVFMQLVMLALFHRRYIWAAVALFAYVHVYLGGVPYAPAIVALYALAMVVAPREDREIPWKMVLITAAGYLAGVLTYPYAGGMWEFLYMQIFGTGLSPDIEVGQEWKPYTDPWFLVVMAGVVLSVWVVALLLRLRFGPRLNARETAAVLIQFGFLLLTLKARRFIEYWPPLALLSAAYLAAPVLRMFIDWGKARLAREPAAARPVLVASVLTGLGLAAFVAWRWGVTKEPGAARLLAEWRVWLFVAGLLLIVPLTRVWVRAAAFDPRAPLRIAAVVGFTALFIVVGLAVTLLFSDLVDSRLAVPGIAWSALAAVAILVPAVALRLRPRESDESPLAPPAVSSVAVVLCGLLLSAIAVGTGAHQIVSASRTARCRYNLAEFQQLTDALRTASKPGDIVFTDDWDIFPPLFYFNSHNHYIVGLDPKFTHARRPDLWERYVKITRAQTPGTIRVASDKPGEFKTERVELSDIRSQFKARFVVIDKDHLNFAGQLAQADELAELIYPAGGFEQNRRAAYFLFRIRDEAESAAILAARKPAADGSILLSSLRPVSVEQGFGQLQFNRSVDGNALRLKGSTYRYGLGSHAESRLVFNIPAGMTTFETWVGVDDETGGKGSIVAAIYLDGKRVFESPQLIGGGDPLRVSIPLAGAKQIMLVAETADEGNRFDHVDWADARFTREAQPASAP